MPDNHRILYFSSQFPNQRNPSMGIFSLQRVGALRRAGCEIMVISPLLMTPPPRLITKPVQAYKWMRQQAQQPFQTDIEGFPVYYPKWICPSKKILGWYMSLFLLFQVRNTVLKLVNSFHPDVILSSWLPDAVAVSNLGKALNIPVLAIADGTDVNSWPDEYPGWNYARDILNKNAATIIFVSKALQMVGHTRKLYGKQNMVLHNAVDISLFRPATGFSMNKTYTVLSVGRFVQGKGYHILLEAFVEFHRSLNQQARLILVGEGPQREELIQQIFRLGISPYVEIVPFMPQQELVKYYQEADIFCLPSFSEGLPCVVVEAMACGKPVVASRVGGIAEVVDDRSGILIAPGDVPALYNALFEVSQCKWDGDLIRKKIVDGFAWEQWSETMVRLMDSLTN